MSEAKNCLIQGTKIKTLTGKEMIQRLLAVLAWEKAVNTTENLPKN